MMVSWLLLWFLISHEMRIYFSRFAPELEVLVWLTCKNEIKKVAVLICELTGDYACEAILLF
jgi:hypothetical protein